MCKEERFISNYELDFLHFLVVTSSIFDAVVVKLRTKNKSHDTFCVTLSPHSTINYY